MADTIIIQKLANGKVEILDSTRPQKYSLMPDMHVYQNARMTGVDVIDFLGNLKDSFYFEDVEKVIHEDLSEVTISDNETLYSELRDYFFFKLAAQGGGGFNYVGEFANFTDLDTSLPAGTSGRFAYVLASQGTKWLPGGMGGSWYNRGWYYDNGTIWIDDKNEIAKGLQDLEDALLPEAPADGQIYTRKGDTEEWIAKSGRIETFDVSAKENNQNANNGEFHGVFKIADQGTYNTFTTAIFNLSLTGAEAFQLRCIIYDLNGDELSQGSLLLDSSSSSVGYTITLDTEIVFTELTGVYVYCGVNDNISGGTVQIFRLTANQTNSVEIANTFQHLTGSLPATRPAVNTTNNVRYQLYYGL